MIPTVMAIKTSSMLRPALFWAGAAAIMLGAAGCKGRTDANMTPTGDTVEVVCDTVSPGTDVAPTDSIR